MLKEFKGWISMKIRIGNILEIRVLNTEVSSHELSQDKYPSKVNWESGFALQKETNIFRTLNFIKRHIVKDLLDMS